jgi:enoyl-CoA hydratase/carnithine racemase
MRCRLGLLVDSKEAERIGLVDVVLGADAVQAEAEKRLAELLKIPGSTATSPASPADTRFSPRFTSHRRVSTGGALSTSLLRETAMQTRHA